MYDILYSPGFLSVVVAVLTVGLGFLGLAYRGARRLAEAAVGSQYSALDALVAKGMEVERLQKKADEYFAAIESVIAEREVWRVLYMDQGAGHDAAQALMMQEISRLSLAYYRVAGREFPLNSTINQVRAAWGEAHGPAARESRAESGAVTKDTDGTKGAAPANADGA